MCGVPILFDKYQTLPILDLQHKYESRAIPWSENETRVGLIVRAGFAGALYPQVFKGMPETVV